MNVVLDANIAVSLVLPLPYSDAASDRVRSWQSEGVEILAPGLWSYEVVSALRKAVAQDWLEANEAKAALRDLLMLGVREVPSTPALHRSALDWAGRLHQSVAYDAAYVALADSLGSELWTADRRLAEAAIRLGVQWIRQLG